MDNFLEKVMVISSFLLMIWVLSQAVELLATNITYLPYHF